MQKRLHEFSFVRQLHPLDGTSGILDELVVAGAFSFLPGDPLGIAVFVDRPHGIGVEAGGSIIVLTRFDEMAGTLGFFCQRLPARRDAREFARDIDKFLYSTGDFLKIALYAGAAVA
jgi:hypothetical protein